MTQVYAQASSQRYIPAAGEPYMSDAQLAYFREKLIRRKEELGQKLSTSIQKVKSLESLQADILDRSNTYIDLEREVKNFERYSNMMIQVNNALERMDKGNFGYCELTGDEIGLKRLEAIPFATMSIQALEEFEASRNHPYGTRPIFS
ncbi:MAG: TraR/DksA C4-type zinc finger protein [Desulfobacter sp.]|nr:MAG: TraR/DksA C4-type zinc finger protein [Desulfobacter sp.]